MSKQNEVKEKPKPGVPVYYTNAIRIGHTPYEFEMDIGIRFPDSKEAKMLCRIVMSPQHMKSLLNAITKNVGRYEKNFGAINFPQGKEPGIDQIG